MYPRVKATGEPEGILRRVSDKYAPDASDSDRINATLLALVRNEEVDDMVSSMVDLERTWNHKFNYPWTFFNDKPFSDDFKRKTSAVTKAKCNYGMSVRRSRIAVFMLTSVVSRAHSHRALESAFLDRRANVSGICSYT